jgi:hypothetical protein
MLARLVAEGVNLDRQVQVREYGLIEFSGPGYDRVS